MNDLDQFGKSCNILILGDGKLMFGGASVGLYKAVFDDNKPETSSPCPFFIIGELLVCHGAVV